MVLVPEDVFAQMRQPPVRESVSGNHTSGDAEDVLLEPTMDKLARLLANRSASGDERQILFTRYHNFLRKMLEDKFARPVPVRASQPSGNNAAEVGETGTSTSPTPKKEPSIKGRRRRPILKFESDAASASSGVEEPLRTSGSNRLDGTLDFMKTDGNDPPSTSFAFRTPLTTRDKHPRALTSAGSSSPPPADKDTLIAYIRKHQAQLGVSADGQVLMSATDGTTKNSFRGGDVEKIVKWCLSAASDGRKIGKSAPVGTGATLRRFANDPHLRAMLPLCAAYSSSPSSNGSPSPTGAAAVPRKRQRGSGGGAPTFAFKPSLW